VKTGNLNLAVGLMRAAYNDYIAARVLLNKNYTLQGAILASTAIEKYFKTLIALHETKVPRTHMNEFERLEPHIGDIGYEILIQKIDRRLINILGDCYKFRYYDNIEQLTTIGFFENQFLGELDGTVELFERLFVLTKEKDGGTEPLFSPL
jgi:HEPN domain-containing protein